MLAQYNDVVAVDINAERIAALNAGHSPIAYPDIEDYLAKRELRLRFTTDHRPA